MLSDARGNLTAPLEQYDVRSKTLRAGVVLAEGTSNGTAIQLPLVSGSVRALFTQTTGAIADSGAVAGTIEQSATGSGGWSTIATFNSAGANDHQQRYATITQPYVRHVAVVTGGGSGTVATTAQLIF